MNLDTYNIVKDLIFTLGGGNLPQDFEFSDDPTADIIRAFQTDSANFLNGLNLPGIARFEVE